MTREEAAGILSERIKALKRFRELRQAELDQWTALDEGESQEVQALEMAISALDKVAKRGKEVKRWKRRYLDLKRQMEGRE